MSTPIRRHPDSATLMSFAAGALAEPLAAVCSVHLSMCAECREELRDMELVGAALLGSTPATGKVAAPVTPPEPVVVERASNDRGDVVDALPAPIATRYGLTLDQIPWKRLAPGVWQHRLALSPGAQGELYFIKLAPGCRLPLHGHTGVELTVVLTGAFVDAFGEYRRGDMQDIDNSIEHQPVGDAEQGCICLVAAEGPYLLKG
ncbi:MAG TPA: ChrR family anti-sigma-E factor [Burkholderiales bacterium]|jgi:putative transcriptional regulator